jgi:hypothetical protein
MANTKADGTGTGTQVTSGTSGTMSNVQKFDRVDTKLLITTGDRFIKVSSTSVTATGAKNIETFMLECINSMLTNISTIGDGEQIIPKKHRLIIRAFFDKPAAVVPFIWVTPAAGADPGTSESTGYNVEAAVETFLGAGDFSLEFLDMIPILRKDPADTAHRVENFEIDLIEYTKKVAKYLENPSIDERPEVRLGFSIVGSLVLNDIQTLEFIEDVEWSITKRPFRL